MRDNTKLVEDSLGPVTDLVIYNVDAFESVAESVVLFYFDCNLVLHHDDVAF